MAILRIKLDHVLSFENLEINFSFPSKLKSSLIENESLKNIPSFRYKKLNVFIGSNASGKTSVIKCIWKTLLFLKLKEKAQIIDILNKNYEHSLIEIDLVDDEEDVHELHRFKILSNNRLPDEDILVSHTFVKLSTSIYIKDSYEKKVKDLDKLEENYKNYLECLTPLQLSYGWNLILPGTEELFDKVRFVKRESLEEEDNYLEILNTTFKVLDPSIKKVYKSNDAENAFVFEHESVGKIIVQDNHPIANIPYLSSGTKYGINIANMLFSIKNHKNGIYLIDEQFSYVNPDIEAAILSTMVSLLGDNEQIFFTTHNYDILSLGFPFHSFYFFRKEMVDEKLQIKVSCGLEAENRNNVSPRTIVDNDLFLTAPDVNLIFNLGDKSYE